MNAQPVAGTRRLITRWDHLPVPVRRVVVRTRRLSHLSRPPRPHVAAGFVDRVVPAADVVPVALAEAARLGSLPAQALRDEKEKLVAERTARIESQLRADLELMDHLGS